MINEVNVEGLKMGWPVSELNLRATVVDVRNRMKTWLTLEGYELPEDVVFEVNLRFKEAFGVEMEPSWSLRVDSHSECDGVSGYGDTVDAALTEFRIHLREKAHGNRLPVFLKKKDEPERDVPEVFPLKNESLCSRCQHLCDLPNRFLKEKGGANGGV